MDRIRISGVGGYDGSYDLNLEQELTTREWGWIKRFAGYLPTALTDEAFSDPELACVLAVIAVRRAGGIQASEAASLYERLIDAPFGTAITIEEGAEEGADADSPPVTSSNGSTPISGPGSPTSSETSTPTPPASGTPGSGTSVSHPATVSAS